MISVAHNLLALNSKRQYNIGNRAKNKTTEKLASGYRINRAADDAAGLAMSEKMRRQIRGLMQAADNSQDGISLCLVADGALSEVNEMLHRITELSVQAANGTNTQEDREAIQEEINQIVQEIDKISEGTTFNEIKLFKGDTSFIGSSGSSQNGIQTSLVAEVKANNVKGGNYQVTATENGGVELSLKEGNGTLTSIGTFNWNEIKNSNDPSKTLADANITDGTYTMEKNGICLSFDITAGSTLTEAAEAIDGAEFEIQKDTKKYIPINLTKSGVIDTAAGANPGAEAFLSDDTYRVHADADGIWMTNQNGTITTTKVTWSSMGVSPDAIAGNQFVYQCPDTGIYANFMVNSNASFDEVLGRLNGAKATYDQRENDYFGRDARYNENSQMYYKMSETVITKSFLEAAIPSKVDRMIVNIGCMTAGSSLSDMKIEINAYKDERNGVLEDNYQTHYLEPDAATRSILNRSNFSAGEQLTMTFTDNYGNKVVLDYSLKTDLTADELAKNVFGASHEFTYHSKTLSMSRNEIIKNNFEVSNMQWQGSNASGTADKKGLWIQCSGEAGIGMKLEIENMSAELLGVEGLDVTTVAGAGDALTKTKEALKCVSRNRAMIGAQQNRLEYTVRNLENVVENTTAAESTIRDADMAKEMMKLSQQNILSQAGEGILAQAQKYNEVVLGLLQ